MALSKKRRAFVEEYLKCWNGAEAARRAGYSERTANVQASQILALPEAQEYVEERLKQLRMDADEALLLLSDIARADIGVFLNDSTLTFELDVNKARELGLTKLIKKVKQKTTTYIGKNESDEDRQVEQLEIELYPADQAIRDILKIHGKFADSLDITSGGEPLKVLVQYADD